MTYDPTVAVPLQSLAPGQTLVDAIAYSVRDTAGVLSAPATVSLNVDGINDAPILGLDNPTFNPTGPTVIRPLDNDSDVDGTIDSTSLLITLQPAFGSLDIDPSGVITYTPFGSFAEVDQFRYTVADDLGLRSEESLVTIAANAAPDTVDDFIGTFLDEAVDINVAANDSDPDGELDLNSVVIVRQPVRGEAIPQANGVVRYVPDTGFIGSDFFEYTIADTEGRVSESARVDVRVVASRLQNPDDFTDVNDDGKVSAIDALLVINRLARAGQARIPVVSTDVGPDYYDVSGDQFISALDALRVINELNIRDTLGFGGEGEQIAPPVGSEKPEVEAPISEIPNIVSDAKKVIDASVAELVDADVIDLIAAGQQARSEGDAIDALDAALGDLI